MDNSTEAIVQACEAVETIPSSYQLNTHYLLSHHAYPSKNDFGKTYVNISFLNYYIFVTISI
jgi:hypothetical protein